MLQRSRWAALVLCLLCACASTPPLGPIHDGESVAIRVVRPQAQGDAWPQVPIRNRAMGKGVSTGAATGSVVGGLWGLACGPFAFLCIPAGAGLGALTGTAGGALVGATGALEADKASRLRARWNEAQKALDLLDDLRQQVADRARSRWNLTADPAAVVVTLEVEDLELTSTRDTQVGLFVSVRVTVQRAGAPQPATTSIRSFEFTAEPTAIDAWLDPQSDYINVVRANCTRQIGAQIVAELART